ncbi:hypothetical protein B0H21DRAFT_353937 [Amylocystis lapponica]|nr:hypothetical protein B0H21DRAFT_353937 [Amylocystis lapponica]
MGQVHALRRGYHNVRCCTVGRSATGSGVYLLRAGMDGMSYGEIRPYQRLRTHGEPTENTACTCMYAPCVRLSWCRHRILESWPQASATLHGTDRAREPWECVNMLCRFAVIAAERECARTREFRVVAAASPTCRKGSAVRFLNALLCTTAATRGHRRVGGCKPSPWHAIHKGRPQHQRNTCKTGSAPDADIRDRRISCGRAWCGLTWATVLRARS